MPNNLSSKNIVLLGAGPMADENTWDPKDRHD